MARDHLPFGGLGGTGGRPDAGRDVTDEFARPGEAATLTVCQLVGRIKEALTDAFPRPVFVAGEISNFKRHSSGHLYFTLKDSAAAIDAVMFRPDAARVRFAIADGLEVVAEGRVDVYERQGRMQLYVRRLTPRGAGALELAFRQLKERLQREGLFAAEAKKPVPPYPRAIGVITSPTGAAVRDIARTLGRRWPAARVYLVGVRVQGDSAAGEIAEAVAALDAAAERLEIDTILLARGGGSLEDLWAFNEEIVARAVFAARTPIVTGVGHETDFTIADFVADLRAATPTAAAEAATPDGTDLVRQCEVLGARLGRALRGRLETARSGLGAVQRSVVFRDPTWSIRSAAQTLDELSGRVRHGLAACRGEWQQRLGAAEAALAAHPPARSLERAAARLHAAGGALAWALGRRARRAADALADGARRLVAVHPRHRLGLAGQRVEALRRQLDAMSYRAVLARGYSVTRRAAGDILRHAADASAGDLLETELADGRVRSRVGSDDATPARPKRPARDGDGEAPTLFDTRQTGP